MVFIILWFYCVVNFFASDYFQFQDCSGMKQKIIFELNKDEPNLMTHTSFFKPTQSGEMVTVEIF